MPCSHAPEHCWHDWERRADPNDDPNLMLLEQRCCFTDAVRLVALRPQRQAGSHGPLGVLWRLAEEVHRREF